MNFSNFSQHARMYLSDKTTESNQAELALAKDMIVKLEHLNKKQAIELDAFLHREVNGSVVDLFHLQDLLVKLQEELDQERIMSAKWHDKANRLSLSVAKITCENATMAVQLCKYNSEEAINEANAVELQALRKESSAQRDLIEHLRRQQHASDTVADKLLRQAADSQERLLQVEGQLGESRQAYNKAQMDLFSHDQCSGRRIDILSTELSNARADARTLRQDIHDLKVNIRKLTLSNTDANAAAQQWQAKAVELERMHTGAMSQCDHFRRQANYLNERLSSVSAEVVKLTSKVVEGEVLLMNVRREKLFVDGQLNTLSKSVSDANKVKFADIEAQIEALKKATNAELTDASVAVPSELSTATNTPELTSISASALSSGVSFWRKRLKVRSA